MTEPTTEIRKIERHAYVPSTWDVARFAAVIEKATTTVDGWPSLFRTPAEALAVNEVAAQKSLPAGRFVKITFELVEQTV